MVKSSANVTIESPELMHLGSLRRRISNGVSLLLGGQLSDDRIESGLAKLTTLQNQYLNTLARYIEEVSVLERAALIERWVERLDTGWGKRETPDVIERFSRLLAEYEALCDAQLGITVTDVRLTANLRLIRSSRALHRGEYAAIYSPVSPGA